MSYNWTDIVYDLSIYTDNLNQYYLSDLPYDIEWSKIPQYPACQILDFTKYFNFKNESVLQIFINLNKVTDVGVSIFFEEKIKVLSRRLKTNMLSYDGPSFHYDDLGVPQDKKGIFSFHQNIYSEEEEKKQCKNYPFNGSASFKDCDENFFHDKFVNQYKVMPFWIATDLSEVTNHRYKSDLLFFNLIRILLFISSYEGEDFVDIFDGTWGSPCFNPCLSTMVTVTYKNIFK